jgi:hypothetical protein
MDPQSTVHYFTGAKDFTIRSGRFRTITGNAYTGCSPPPASPVQARPRVVSATSFFAGASDFEIGGGEFSVIDGDAVDLGRAFDGLGPVFLGVNEGDQLGVDGEWLWISYLKFCRGERHEKTLLPRLWGISIRTGSTFREVSRCLGLRGCLSLNVL